MVPTGEARASSTPPEWRASRQARPRRFGSSGSADGLGPAGGSRTSVLAARSSSCARPRFLAEVTSTDGGSKTSDVVLSTPVEYTVRPRYLATRDMGCCPVSHKCRGTVGEENETEQRSVRSVYSNRAVTSPPMRREPRAWARSYSRGACGASCDAWVLRQHPRGTSRLREPMQQEPLSVWQALGRMTRRQRSKAVQQRAGTWWCSCGFQFKRDSFWLRLS